MTMHQVKPVLVSHDRWFTNPDVLTTIALRLRRTLATRADGVDGFIGAELSPADCRALAVELASDVVNGSYEPGTLRRLFRRRGERVRMFKVPPFRDRVLQTALLYGMGPHLARHFAPNSYGVRGSDARLGVSDVVNEIERFRVEHRDDPIHLVTTDVARFFDSIPHALLKRLIRGTFSSRRINRVISGTLERGQTRPGRGLPQGAPLSPLLANMCLNEVDWFFHQRKTVFYARYVDDIMIVVRGDIERAKANLLELERQVHRLGLQLNHDKTVIAPAAEGANFLGFRFRLGARGVEVTPNERSQTRLKKRLNEVPEDGNTTVNLHAAKAAWAAYFSDLSPEAVAIGDRLVAAEAAARLLRRSVARPPSKRPEETR